MIHLLIGVLLAAPSAHMEMDQRGEFAKISRPVREGVETGGLKDSFGCKERVMSGAVVQRLDAHTYEIYQELFDLRSILKTTKTKITTAGEINICVRRKTGQMTVTLNSGFKEKVDVYTEAK